MLFLWVLFLKPGCHVTFRTAFDPTSNGKELWQDLAYDGDLDSFEVGEFFLSLV